MSPDSSFGPFETFDQEEINLHLQNKEKYTNILEAVEDELHDLTDEEMNDEDDDTNTEEDVKKVQDPGEYFGHFCPLRLGQGRG